MTTFENESNSSNSSPLRAGREALELQSAFQHSLQMLEARTVSLDSAGVVVALPLRQGASPGIACAQVGVDYLEDILRRTGLDERGSGRVREGRTGRDLVDRIRTVISEGGSVAIPAGVTASTTNGVTLHASCTRDDDGVVVGVTVVEVAHGTAAQETATKPSVAHQSAVLEALLSTIPYRIWWKDKDSRYLGCNSIFADKAGLQSPTDIVGKNDFDFPWGESAGSQMRADDKEVMDDGPKLEYRERVIQADSTIEVSASKVPLIDDRGDLIGVLGMFCDISDQVATQRELADERVRLAKIVETIPFEVAWKGRDHRFIGCNSAFAERAGLSSPEEVIGLRATELTGDRASASFQERDEALMVSGEELLHEAIHFADAEGRLCQAEVSRIPIRGVDGEVTGLLVMAIDHSERAQLESQLADASKMEAIGQLASGVAHEINTPIQFVGDNIGFVGSTFEDLLPLLVKAQSLAKAVEAGESNPEDGAELVAAIIEADLDFMIEEIPGAIEQSVEGIDRVTKIIRGLKEFAHPGGDAPEPADVNHTIQSTVAVAANEWKYVAEVQFDLAPDLPSVTCMPAKLAQALLVIIVNAAQAISEANDGGNAGLGRIDLSTRAEGNTCEIRIADDGPGMSDEVQNRIFEPFFTTKGVGVGSGQGLPIAQRIIISDHGGRLDVLSEPGEGTTFVIQIPIEPSDQL